MLCNQLGNDDTSFVDVTNIQIIFIDRLTDGLGPVDLVFFTLLLELVI